MSYSRRNFLKAAGYGAVMSAIGGDSLFAASLASPPLSSGAAAPF